MILQYSKVHAQALAPSRAHPSDAGLDVFYCPPGMRQESNVVLRPGQNIILPTGLKFGIPHGYALVTMNRAGMAAKRNLVVGSQLSDPNYSGEIFVDIHNIGQETQVITTGAKIAQLVMVPVVHFRAMETALDQLYVYPLAMSDRGENKLGSTGDSYI
jgi:dUTP pyrophosphatase